MSENTDQKDKITIGGLTSWVLGIFFILGSFAVFKPESQGMGIASILIACLLFPPIRRAIHKKTGRSLSTGLRIVLFIILVGVGASTVPHSELTINNVSVAQSAPSLTTSSPSPAQPKQQGIVVESFTIEHGEYGIRKIVGTVKNNTNKQPNYVQLEFNLYDGSGSQVGSTLANVNNLEPGGTWKFEAPLLEERATEARLKGITSF